MWRKLWRVSSLKYVAAFLIPLIIVMFLTHELDNDSWYVLAEGREIVNNGIYYTDTLSMHEGLEVTVQNYGFAAVFYLIFEIFGAAGLYIGMLILNFAVCLLLYKICMLLSNKNTNLSLFIMMMTDFLLAAGFAVTRAQMVSFVIFLALIYILELYIKTDKTRYLWWIPVLSVLQINLHASLWLMLWLVLITYIIDAIRKPKLHLQGYRMKPLIVVGIIGFLCGLINPYGVKMITFIITSYFNVRFNGMVGELASFSPFSNVSSFFIYLAIVIVLFLTIFGNKRNVRVRYLLMFFGFLALGLNTIKGLSQFILVMFFPLALIYKNVRVEKVIDAKIARNALVFWIGVVSLAIFAYMCPTVASQVKDHPSESLVAAVDVIEKDIEEKDNKDKTIYTDYTGYNDGGYLEFRGYKPYMDSRGEVFLKKNNGKEDLLYEWDDFLRGEISVVEMLDKYKFDYILARGESDPFYKMENDGYEKIFEDEDEKIRVFRRKT